MTVNMPPTDDERAQLRERNMEAIRERFSEIADALETFSPLSTLVFDEDGQPDMLFESQYFYDQNMNKFVDEQLERYWTQPSRIFNETLQPSEFDKHTGDFLNSVLQRTAVEKGTVFARHRIGLESYYLISFGIGLGAHIDALVEKLDTYVLILFDPNLEGLYHSLEVYDWAGLFERMEAKKGAVYIKIESEPEKGVEFVRWRMRQSNIVSIDGMHLFVHYNNPNLINMRDMLLKDANLIIAGLGFFRDETIMLRNVHKTFYDGTARVFLKSPDPRQNIPAVIVGCGPSLDKDIGEIKRIADHAVIFSSGSALGPLLANDIIPQFQIELENIEVLDVLQVVLDQYDVSDICLVCSSTVDPNIIEHFNRIIYHFRAGLSTYPLYSNDDRHTIPNHDPTVVNASLAFAQELGFREYYFFGCDMGTKDPTRHHATDSYHSTDDAIVGDRNFSIEVKGNFGGKAYTTNGLNWALNQFERAVKMRARGYRYHNCSDGCYVPGTEPMLAKRMELPPPSSLPADVVDQIYQACPVYSREEFEIAWNDDRISDGINEMIDRIIGLIEETEDFRDTGYLSDFNTIATYSPGRMGQCMAMLFRGTLQMSLMCLEFYLGRVDGDEEKVQEFMEVCREELISELETLRKDGLEILGSLTRDRVAELTASK